MGSDNQTPADAGPVTVPVWCLGWDKTAAKLCLITNFVWLKTAKIMINENKIGTKMEQLLVTTIWYLRWWQENYHVHVAIPEPLVGWRRVWVSQTRQDNLLSGISRDISGGLQELGTVWKIWFTFNVNCLFLIKLFLVCLNWVGWYKLSSCYCDTQMYWSNYLFQEGKFSILLRSESDGEIRIMRKQQNVEVVKVNLQYMSRE